jgi:translation initiation factor IF-3
MRGAMPTLDALVIAREAGMDLVEVAPDERPPVCRIMDYGKFKYEQKKKASKNTKTHQVQVKEIRLRPRTGDHDVEVKLKQARGFLADRDKVKVKIQFRGREMAHVELGKKLLLDVITKLEDVAKVEQEPRMETREFMAVLSPK